MAYLQIGDQQFLLRAGAQRIAPDATADIPLPGADPTATAVIDVIADHRVVIRRGAADSVVSVNGVALGAEPSPLMHGDRVQIGGRELRFGDASQAGSTQFVSRSAVADVLRARGSGPAKPTTATGGRLVSLVDGREYVVARGGLVIGRDPAADIVVPVAEVSRRHARIAPDETGYVLTDLSTNGVWVNGGRVDQQQVLGRGDIIRIAAEEFRFYADAVKPGPPVQPVVAAPQPSVTPPHPPDVLAQVPDSAISVGPTSSAPVAAPVAVPVVPVAGPVREPEPAPAPAAAQAPPPPSGEGPAAARPLLAVLEILNEGPTKGMRYEVSSPLTNIGRGAYNDVVLASESVSDSHAKLQLRDAGWVLQDVGSRNGTYVGGRRVEGEHPIAGKPDLRFGDIKLSFTSIVKPEGGADKGTRAITGVTLDQVRRASERKGPPPSTPARSSTPPPESADASQSRWVRPLMLLAVIIVAVWWFFFRGA